MLFTQKLISPNRKLIIFVIPVNVIILEMFFLQLAALTILGEFPPAEIKISASPSCYKIQLPSTHFSYPKSLEKQVSKSDSL